MVASADGESGRCRIGGVSIKIAKPATEKLAKGHQLSEDETQKFLICVAAMLLIKKDTTKVRPSRIFPQPNL